MQFEKVAEMINEREWRTSCHYNFLLAPDADVVYATSQDLWSQVPLTLFILIVRYTLEKYWFRPLGKWFKISDAKRKPVPHNDALEAAYSKSTKCKDSASLAKQSDLTERQVERWWRLRRSQDKPSTLVKFTENMWKGTFGLYNFSCGLYVLWDKEWLWDMDKITKGVNLGITSDIWWYYMISSAFYWSLTLTQFWDVRRKDFWQMFVHHIATIALLSFSWVCNLHRIGTLVLLLHDCADIFVESVKAAKYANYQRTCDTLFLMLIVVWIFTRVGIYPFYIIWSTSIRAPMLLPMFPAYYIFNFLLCLLLVLHVVWTWLILQIAYITIQAGQMEGDIRSSSSELSDSPHNSNHSTPKVKNKKVKPNSE